MVLKDNEDFDEIDAPPPVNQADCNDDNQELFDEYRAEIYRRESFNTWPRWAQADPIELARNGLYYLGNSDRVKCAFCHMVLKNWESKDIVEEEHKKFSPNCPFLLGIVKGNIPYVRSPDDITKNARMPKYAKLNDRLNSYKDWPKALKQRPKELAAAGFYYTGHSDNVECFMCGGLLKNWEESDEPWIEHKKWFPLCLFILENDPRHNDKAPIHHEIKKNFRRSFSSGALEKGYAKDLIKVYKDYKKDHNIPESDDLDQFIEELEQFKIQNDTQPHSNPESLPSASNITPSGASNAIPTSVPYSDDGDRTLCTICMEREREITFVPCCHFVTCEKCSKQVKKCPLCREKIKGSQRTYLN